MNRSTHQFQVKASPPKRGLMFSFKLLSLENSCTFLEPLSWSRWLRDLQCVNLWKWYSSRKASQKLLTLWLIPGLKMSASEWPWPSIAWIKQTLKLAHSMIIRKLTRIDSITSEQSKDKPNKTTHNGIHQLISRWSWCICGFVYAVSLLLRVLRRPRRHTSPVEGPVVAVPKDGVNELRCMSLLPDWD